MGGSFPRKLVERFSRSIVLLRRLPREFQSLPLYVTPEAGLRHWGSIAAIDPLLLRMTKELVRPRACVWDVGANVGLFTFSAAAMAGASGCVLAIEPDVWLAHLLHRSATLIRRRQLRAAHVEVLCAAISYQGGVHQLEIADRARAANHLTNSPGSSQAGGARHLQPTVAVTLDALLDHFPAPGVLKIDVEHHEGAVLRGATRLLELFRPVIWCEVDPANAERVTEILCTKDYRLFGAAENPHPAITRAWWNTLAVPAEKVAAQPNLE